MRNIEIGKVYKHFKNKYYLVVDIVNDCESNNEAEYRKIVIYKALYGEHLTWARPYEMFASEVDHEKYPEVTQQYRFEEVDVDIDDVLIHLHAHDMLMNALVNMIEENLEND